MPLSAAIEELSIMALILPLVLGAKWNSKGSKLSVDKMQHARSNPQKTKAPSSKINVDDSAPDATASAGLPVSACDSSMRACMGECDGERRPAQRMIHTEAADGGGTQRCIPVSQADIVVLGQSSLNIVPSNG